MGNFYIISGDDDFARKQRTRDLAASLSGESDPQNAESVEIIQGDQPELKPEMLTARFLDSLRTPPFLCPSKLVWMRHHPDLSLFTEDKTDAAMKELCDILTAELPEEINVLLDGPGLDRRKARVKEFKNAGAEIEVFNTAKSSDRNFAETRRGVLNDFAKNSGKKITYEAMQFLTEAVAGDSGTLANELEKLLCYCAASAEITLEDCQAVISRTQETLNWEFTAAVVAGERSRALLTLAALLNQRESSMEIRLLSSLSSEYQRMIQTRLAMKQLNISRPFPGAFDNIAPELKSQFPANPLLKLHPFRAFKVCEAAMKFSSGDLAEKLSLIRDTSRALVSGGGDNRILLEQLVIKLT